MVTFTNKEKDPDKIERFPQIGSDSPIFLGRKRSNTSFFPKKKYIVISARVHPSEVASSYVIRAFTNYILRNRYKDSKRYGGCYAVC